MQGPSNADEASIPTPTMYAFNPLLLGATVQRKATKKRILPRPAVKAENSALPPREDDETPPAAKRPRLRAPTADEIELASQSPHLPHAKRRSTRLHAPTRIPTAADGVVPAHTAARMATEKSRKRKALNPVPTLPCRNSTRLRVTTDSSDDTPTDPVTPAASLPSAATSRAPSRSWTPEEDAKLRIAVKKHGNDWVAVAKLVPGRMNHRCRQRWVQTLDPANDGKKLGKWTPAEDSGKETWQRLGRSCQAGSWSNELSVLSARLDRSGVRRRQRQ
jgi:hypothetical protein